MHATLCSTVLLALAAVVPSSVHGHGQMLEPKPRPVTTKFRADAGPLRQAGDSELQWSPLELMRQRVQADQPQAPTFNIMNGCRGMVYESGNPVTELAVGVEFPIKWFIQAPHPGYGEFNIVKPTTDASGKITYEKVAMLKRLEPFGTDGGNFETTATIPSSVTGCEKAGDCALQMHWHSDIANQTYPTCSDITITGSGEADNSNSDSPVSESADGDANPATVTPSASAKNDEYSVPVSATTTAKPSTPAPPTMAPLSPAPAPTKKKSKCKAKTRSLRQYLIAQERWRLDGARLLKAKEPAFEASPELILQFTIHSTPASSNKTTMLTPSSKTVLALAATAVAIASAPGAVDAHGYMSIPKATFTISGDTTQFSGTIDGPTTLTAPSGMSFTGDPASNTKAFTAALKASTYKSVYALVEAKGAFISGATKECGITSTTGTKQPLPAKYVEWSHSSTEGFTASHQGPCEVWCDDKMAFSDENCAADYTSAPAKLPIDHAKCVGTSLLKIVWLALHSSTWQIYINCAPLEGSTSSSDSAASSSTTTTTVSPTVTPSSAATTTPTTTKASTPAPSATKKKCTAKTSRTRRN